MKNDALKTLNIPIFHRLASRTATMASADDKRESLAGEKKKIGIENQESHIVIITNHHRVEKVACFSYSTRYDKQKHRTIVNEAAFEVLRSQTKFHYAASALKWPEIEVKSITLHLHIFASRVAVKGSEISFTQEKHAICDTQ